MHLLCRLEETAGAKVLLRERVLRTKGDVRQSYHICQVMHHQHPPPPPHPLHSLTNHSTRQWTSYGINMYGVEWRKRMSKGSIASLVPSPPDGLQIIRLGTTAPSFCLLPTPIMQDFIDTSTQSTTAGVDTKEYQTIKRHFDTLVDNLGSTVGDPARFSRRLREKSLISDGECTRSHRLASFLNGVHVHSRRTNTMCTHACMHTLSAWQDYTHSRTLAGMHAHAHTYVL